MSQLILWDDDAAGLAPLTDLRASFELRTGAMTTAERLGRQVGMSVSAVFVPQRLAGLVAERCDARVNELPAGAEPVMVINGRWPRLTCDLPIPPNTAWLSGEGTVLAAHLDREDAHALLVHGHLPSTVTIRTDESAKLIARPWHVIEQFAGHLDHDLASPDERLTPFDPSTKAGVVVVGPRPVLVGQDVTIYPSTVFDTTQGPICIDDGAEIRALAVVVGPTYIGAHTQIANHAHIRGHNVIGPWCKVGGEVVSSVFQGFANKAHAGFVGHSFVGEWVNLGAGTDVSNLKNTYSPVAMQACPQGSPEPTGMQFLGAVLGDHVKTAVGTRLNTGSCVHTGAMIAASGFPDRCVAPFAFLTDQGERLYDLAKFLETAATVMARRDQPLTPAMAEAITILHTPVQAVESRATA